jgi:hypothetical protein
MNNRSGLRFAPMYRLRFTDWVLCRMRGYMSKVFGIVFILLLSSIGHTQESVNEQKLMAAVETSLNSSVHCYKFLAPLGNALGKEIGLWWRKRQIRKNYVLPLFEKVQSLKSEDNGKEKIALELELFEDRIFEEQPIFHACSDKTEAFFKNIRNYVEFTTTISAP